MTAVVTNELVEAANEAAGNWKRFESFVWHRRSEVDDPDQWAIVYTHHRESGLLDLSNASVIEKELQSFTEGDDPDVVFESHSHWAVGHIDGFSIRVFRCGQVTDAFRAWHAIAERKASYPILDEEDYSQREYEATIENIDLAVSQLDCDYTLPEDWQHEVYSWLLINRAHAIENRSDQGGFPHDEDLKVAFTALSYKQVE